MKEKITIVIEDLDDIQGVFKSLDILFKNIILYYTENDLKKLNTFVLSISSYFGILLGLLGYKEDDFRKEEDNSGEDWKK
jgi:hypothetical protein